LAEFDDVPAAGIVDAGFEYAAWDWVFRAVGADYGAFDPTYAAVVGYLVAGPVGYWLPMFCLSVGGHAASTKPANCATRCTVFRVFIFEHLISFMLTIPSVIATPR
jgi:hypothetical protein